MELREPQAVDLKVVKQLWSCCFEKEDEPFFQWFFSRRYQAEAALGAFSGEQLLAALHIVPYKLFLRGNEMPAGYIMGVGTFPEYRRRGIMRSLLVASLEKMRREQQWISVLLPRRPSVYEPHGWEICYYNYRYSIPAWLFPGSLAASSLRLASSVTAADCQILNTIYRCYMSGRHGYVIRDNCHWDKLISENESEGGEIRIYEPEGAPQGYIISLPHAERILVKEMAYTCVAARDALLGSIKALAGTGATIEWQLPVDDLTFLKLTDHREAVSLYPFMAGRIVDVVKAVELSAASPGLTGVVNLKIVDELAPWNDGYFQFTVKNGAIQVKRCETATIEMTIGDFTRLFLGALNIDDLIEMGVVTDNDTEEIALLRRLWPRMKNAISDTI